ncbi:MAG: hypothetical protein PHQ60_09520 [Sideroxydans sp.]|nr:hypothetical protein [Sideroxydans sp.]
MSTLLFWATGNRQQATGNRQQATGNRQQATGNRQQATGNRQQAWLQKHRLTRWLAKLFVALSLVVSGEALAEVETVPPVQKWAVANGVNSLWNFNFYQLSKSEACLFFYNTWVVNAGYPPHTYIGDNGTYCRWTNFFDHLGIAAQQGIYWSKYDCPDPNVNPDVPYTYRPATNTCERELKYKLTLTPDSATIEPGQSYEFTATVTTLDDKQPGISVPVSVKAEVEANSGGHDHGEKVAKRDKGKVSPANGSNSFQINFTSTQVSGIHTITATCDQCVNKTAVAKVNVMVASLETIPSSAFYAFIGGEEDKPHHDNHYLTPAAAERLLVMAINYRSQQRFKVLDWNTNIRVTPSVLHVNDASLMWGGRFDIKANWTNPHITHMRGIEVDIRANDEVGAIDARNFKAFEKMLDDVVGGKTGRAKYLLECTADKPGSLLKHERKAENLCISRLTLSPDTNRHYHIRLIGAK